MKTTIKIFHWIPRILCILAILFVSLFALDSFNAELTLWEQFRDFFMHMIPSLVLLLLLILAWKKEFIGGILFIILGVGFSPFIYNHNYAMNQSVFMSLTIIAMITLPFVVVGVLFVISHFLKKKEMAKEKSVDNT